MKCASQSGNSGTLLHNRQGFAQLQWRSRRGMLELDLVFAAFTERAYPYLHSELQQAYQDLLEAEDPYLYQAVILGKPVLATHRDIVDCIRNFSRQPANASL